MATLHLAIRFPSSCRSRRLIIMLSFEQDAESKTLHRDLQTPIPMDVFKGKNAQSQGTVSTRKRAGPETSDAAMKRPRKEQTSAQDMSSCGNPVQKTRQKLKPLLPTFPGGLMQARYLESPRKEAHVVETAVGERPQESKKLPQLMASICEHQRRRSLCKECKGSGICEHQRRRNTCKECKGSCICEHQRRRSQCKECRDAASARTT